MADTMKLEVSLFQNLEVRKLWYRDEWYFPINDIVFVLTESRDTKTYIRDIKRRDYELTKGWGKISHPLWINTRWWRQQINCCTTKWALRLIQSIPSPKAEPFKQWLASLGSERIDEINDPELWIQRAKARAIEIWRNKGYSEQWIAKRLQSISTRNSFTDVLKERGIKDWFEYALLTNKVYTIWLWVSWWATWYKQIKWLKKNDNLRDHMDNLEIALVDLAEAGSQKIIEEIWSEWFEQVQDAVTIWSETAWLARQNIEEKIGRPIISKKNYLTDRQKGRRKQLKNE